MRCLASLLALLLASAAHADADYGTGSSSIGVAGDPDKVSTAIAAAEELSTAFEVVAETISPSVVMVRSSRAIQATRSRRGRRGSPFEEFFGDEFFDRFNVPPQQRQRIQQGLGSGVIVSESGNILTNNHVVSGADGITVVLTDGREFEAEIVGADPRSDIAVINIDADGLTPADLGDSDQIRVGQWVVAAGNPFGLSSTITTGIVSAKSRSGVGIADYEDFIQTDAAINSGNSGGPLVNLRGEVVGINTAMISQFGGSIGIGFAIPINMAKGIMEDLVSQGQVVRGYLGVRIQDLSAGLAESLGYSTTDGVLVSEVVRGAPAARGGLRSGDIITEFNQSRVEDMARFRMDIADVDPGTQVELAVFREGETVALSVTIEATPTRAMAAPVEPRSNTPLGIDVETLTPERASQLDLDPELRGVLVTSVGQGGIASQTGIRSGDVITQVQDTPVHDSGGFDDAVREAGLASGVQLTIYRGSQRRIVFMQVR